MASGVWGIRDFRLIVGANLINDTGDWLLLVALPAFVYTETGSGRSTAAVVIIELVVGVVVGPLGGSLADRWDLRRTVVATNALQAVTLLPLLAVTTARIWPIFVVAGIQGMLRQVNDPASFALVPRVVPAEHLTQANAANAAAGSIARLVGAPLGGIAVALGGVSTVVVVDAATFSVAAIVTSFVRTPTPSLVVDGGDDGGSVRDGWRAVRQHRALVGYLGVQSLAEFTFAMFPVLFIAFVIDVLDGDEATIGIIRGTAAFGALGAALLVGRAARRVEPTTLMMAGYTGLGLVAFVFVNASEVTTALWIFLVLFAVSGLPNMSSQIGAVGAAQQLCPPAVLGRLRGVEAAAGAVGAVLGSLVVALLIDQVAVQVLFNVQAALYVVCGLSTYLAIIRRG